MCRNRRPAETFQIVGSDVSGRSSRERGIVFPSGWGMVDTGLPSGWRAAVHGRLHMPQAPISQVALLIWLAAYAIALLAAVGSAWLTCRPGRVPAVWWNAVRLGWLAVVSLAVVDAVRRGRDAVLEGDPLVVQFPVITGGIVVLAVMAVQEAAMRSRPHWRRWGGRVFHVCGSVALLAAVSHRFLGLTTATPASLVNLASGGSTASVSEVHALTDGGTPIPLMRLLPQGGIADPVGEHASLVPERFACRVIDSGAPTASTNCHGWVFTDGDYLVPGEHVDSILAENSYEPVERPRIDDLIVYRDEDGRVIHTGRVKAVGRAGFTLIESKWGSLHTYLHLPEDQCYSAEYGFYRSPRSGHRLTLVNGPLPDPLQAGDSQEPAELARTPRPRGFGTALPSARPKKPRQG